MLGNLLEIADVPVTAAQYAAKLGIKRRGGTVLH